jgi:hypothetical protein
MDLLALVRILPGKESSSYENQAWPRERLGTPELQPTLSVLRDQLLAFGRRRSAWVSVNRQKLHALVGARKRGSRQAWEIDYLIDCCGDERVVAGLLTQAVQAAGDAGAEKLFMRLDAASGLLTAAREAGFFPYQEETLYGLNRPLGAEAIDCRAATSSDSYPLFRLYTACTPEPVRRHEAVTYAEWQSGMERRWMRGGIEVVREREGRLQAHARASRLAQGVLFDLTLTADAVPDALGMMAAAMQAIDGDTSGPLLALVPSQDEGVARRLEDAGFLAAREFVSLVHRTTRPLTLPKAVPAVAKNAVGV